MKVFCSHRANFFAAIFFFTTDGRSDKLQSNILSQTDLKPILIGLISFFSLQAEVRGYLAPPPHPDSNGVYMEASFLMWQAKLWGLEFASKSFVPNTAGAVSQTFQEKLFVPDFAWRPGGKFLIGGPLPHDRWDLQGSWTFYREECTDLKKNFDSQIAPADIGIIPLWPSPFFQIIGGNSGNPLRYSEAAGNWKMTFNAWDLELARQFSPEESIPMRLKMGAKFSKVTQHYYAKYAGGTTQLAFPSQGAAQQLTQFLSSDFHAKIDQWGLGPRIGLESLWHMFYGVSLIGNGAFSMLYSFFDVHSSFRDIVQPNSGENTMKMREHIRELTPILEAMLGLHWETTLRDAYVLSVRLGYEWQFWWAMNHLRRQYVQTLPGETFDMRGELQMQGLSAAIKFDF